MRHALAIVFLTAATIVVYFPAANYGFINYDDPMYVTDNPVVLAGVTPASLVHTFTDTSISLFTPLTLISYQIEIELFGLSPSVMHRTNIALHALNAILLYLLLFRLTSLFWPSFLVAVIFSVHPTHVESVAWITERKDVLSTFFWMLTCHAWLSFLRTRSRQVYGLTILLFILGLLSKPMVVTLPLALLVLDFWPLERLRSIADIYGLVREKIPFFLLSLASAVETVVTQPPGDPESSLALTDRVTRPIVAYVEYLVRTFYPVDLAAIYPLPQDGFPVYVVLGCAALLCALTAICLWLRRRAPYLMAGWAWFILTLLPVSGVIPLRSVLVADRFTYIPTVGLYIAVAWSIHHVLRAESTSRVGRSVAAIGCLVVVACLSVLANAQVRVWKDSETLFTDALRATGPNVLAYTQLAAICLDQGRLEEAQMHAQSALELHPGFTVANDLLAGVHIAYGNYADAIPYLEEAVRNQHRRATVLQRLAAAHHALGELGIAEKYYRESIIEGETRGSVPEGAANGLVKLLIDTNRLDEAETVVLKNTPNLSESGYFYFMAGNVASAQGRDTVAAERYMKAVDLEPELMFAWVNLGNLKARSGDLHGAIVCYQRAVEIDATYRLAHQNLAQAYRQVGEATLAEEHQTVADALSERTP